jgi:putative phosphoesterase
MRIGILSDTHLTDLDITTQSFKYQYVMTSIRKEFQGVSHIIHAGDVCSEEFIFELEKFSPVSVVRGNMDENTGIFNWPRALTLEFENVSIGVAHDIQVLLSLPDIRVGIHGHTHIPEIREIRPNFLLINPGSLTFPRASPPKKFFPGVPIPKPSLAILTLDHDLETKNMISAILVYGKKTVLNNK